MELRDNKKYVVCPVQEIPAMFYNKHYEDNSISEDILLQLAKAIGISRSVYDSLDTIPAEVFDNMLSSMCKKSDLSEIAFLVDEERSQIVGYTTDSSRLPVLNNEFIKRVNSSVENYTDIVTISDISYNPADSLSSILLKKVSPITIEEMYENQESKYYNYQIGILLLNDELSTTSSRLVVYIEGQPLYLPSSYYNVTSSRYRRSTNNSLESLEVFLLKVLEDMRDDNKDISDRVDRFHSVYKINKEVLASYEEYNKVLNTMSKIPTIIDDNSFIESLVSKYENFEKKYIRVDDQKSSYIWRCTAIGDISIGNLISLTSHILNDLYAPLAEYYDIRDLLGSYISTRRIIAEIAKEDIDS